MSEPLLTPEMTGLADQLDADWREVRKALSGPMATVEGLTRAEAAMTRLFGTRATVPDRLRFIISKRLADTYVAAAEDGLRRRGQVHALTVRQQKGARIAQALGVPVEDFIRDEAEARGLQDAAA